MQPAARHEPAMGFRVWRTQPSQMMEMPHTHPDIEINFLFRGGRLRYLHGGDVHVLESERLAVLWGGVPHQTLAPGIMGNGLWITLPLTWFLQWELPNDLTRRLLTGEIIQGAPLEGEHRIMERWLEDHASGATTRRRVLLLEIEARLHRLALEQTRPARRKKSTVSISKGLGHIARITGFLAEHYREPLSVKTIAQNVGLHPKYLMRTFKKNCRLGVWEYLTRLRVSHAQRLLIATDLKVLDVAMESGFSSVAPFYTAFALRSGGLSPLIYRRRHRLSNESGGTRRPGKNEL